MSTIASNLFYRIGDFFGGQSVHQSTNTLQRIELYSTKPAWVSVKSPEQYRLMVEDNPIVRGCIDILANAASNGVKYLEDSKGNREDWNSNKAVVRAAKKLFVESPNPIQSQFEFQYERYYMKVTFGNNYVYLLNPTRQPSSVLNVVNLKNLPSEYVEVRQTGKYWDQTTIEGIIDSYALINENPIREFKPDQIIHFNELNTSGKSNSLIGVPKLHNLRQVIENTQKAFEAMNVLLSSRGMQGIIKSTSKDPSGTQVMMQGDLKKDVDSKFQNEYGILNGQKQILFTFADVDYIRTVMTSEELGIYKELSNNAMIISNGLGIPPELYKTYIQGATFENQVQAVRRLYQDTVIPMVKNDDQYWTSKLRLNEFGYTLKTDWSKIAALQENIKENAQALSMNVKSANTAWNDNQITRNQYLEMINQPTIVGGDVYKYEFNATQNEDTENNNTIDDN